MADDIERLILEMSTDLKRFEKGLDRANKIAEKRLSSIERRAELMNSSILKSTGRMTDGLRNLLAAVGVGLAIRQIADYADAWTRGANQIATAGVAMEGVLSVQERLFASAQRTRTALEDNFSAFSKVRRATQDLGATDEQVLRTTEILTKAFKAGGASANEQASALLQLGQALGSGVLQGDELRSIRENSPVLAKAIAKEFGVTVAGLKKLGEEGKLTSDKVFTAILKGGRDIDAQFARTTPTIAESFVVLQNAASKFVAELDRATGASKTFGNFVIYVADNLDLLVHAAAIAATVVGGALAGQAILAVAVNGVKAAQALGLTTAAVQALGARTAVTAAATRGLSAALALVGGPIGLFLTAAGIAAAFFAVEALRAGRVSEDVTKVTDALTIAISDYSSAAADASVATGKERIELEKVAKAKRQAAIEARDLARAQLQQANATLAAVLATQAQLRQSANMPTVVGSTGAGGVQAIGIANQENRRKDAQASVDAAREAYQDAAKQIAAIDKLLENPPTLDSSLGKPTGSSQRGRTVADLRLAAQIDAARVAKNEELAERLEDQADLAKRIQEYESAGLKGDAAKVAAAQDLASYQAARLKAQQEERADIAARTDLDAASTAEILDQVRAMEASIEIRDRIRDYQSTGLSMESATTAAKADQAKLEAARATSLAKYLADQQRDLGIAEAKADLDFAREEALTKAADQEDRIRDYQERGLSLTQATTQAMADLLRLEEARTRERQRYLAEGERDRQQQLAEIRGQEELARAIDRQQELARRSRDYQENGGLSPADANRRARLEISEEAYADAQARFRDVFGGALKEALQSGDVLEAGGALLDAASDKMLDKIVNGVSDSLFNVLAEQFPKIFDTGQDLLGATAASATMSTGIATGGAAAATAMGAAIVSAGAAAAAAMAAAIVAASTGSSITSALGGGGGGTGFSGFAATGRSVSRGRRYTTQERGPEPFVPTSQGVVFSTQAMRGLADLGKLAGSSKFNQAAPLTIEVNNNGAPVTATVESTPRGVQVNLTPIGDQMIDNAGRTGKLARAARLTPRPKVRG